MKTVSGLKVTLHDQLVGYLTHNQPGATNVFQLDDSFIDNPDRPALTLALAAQESRRHEFNRYPKVSQQQLPPILSNLLPEGALRDVTAQRLKVHTNNEFALMAHMGRGLAGGLVLTPQDAAELPGYALGDTAYGQRTAIDVDDRESLFSLAGVQMKFSMRSKDGRYILGTEDDMGDWIVKTPSTTHKFVPYNEYTAMKLAESIGVSIPDVRLIPLGELRQLPEINLPDEAFAYGIKRFDRSHGKRIHTEDFAQVFEQYPLQKYEGRSYHNIAELLYRYSIHGQKDAVQMAIRLLANILLANGDAHLKNWSLIYSDKLNPSLSPAYDIVTTAVYMTDEEKFALSLGSTKHWYQVTLEHFQRWAKRAGLPERIIMLNLKAAVQVARDTWPRLLEDMPMLDEHKAKLKAHLRQLKPDFKIEL